MYQCKIERSKMCSSYNYLKLIIFFILFAVNEVYGTLYPNQLYVDNPVMNGSHEKLSHPGSGIVYIYDGNHPCEYYNMQYAYY